MSVGRFEELETQLAQRTNYELQRPPPGGFNLERMQRLVAALGHPERSYPVVHVAGTTGKGTTCAGLASVLDAAGLRVGLFTSPHLIDLRERIRLGPLPATDKAWLAAADEVLAAPTDEAPTYFELITAMAFVAFRNAAVDVAVVEVGLGGRLDATNVVRPLATVVTRIALDHTDLLGDDVATIAREKAGIFKPGVLAIAGPESDAAQETLVARAAEVGAPLQLLGRDATVNVIEPRGRRTLVRVATPARMHHVNAPLAAAATGNLGLVALATGAVGEHLGRDLASALTPGLERLTWRGRFDVLEGDPPIVVDGAHDPGSLAGLLQACATLFSQRPVLLFAMAKDKAVAEAAALLAPACTEAFCCAFDSPRASVPAELAAALEAQGAQARVVEGVEPALRAARARANETGAPLLVTGSLYLAGAVLELLGEDVRAAWRPPPAAGRANPPAREGMTVPQRGLKGAPR